MNKSEVLSIRATFKQLKKWKEAYSRSELNDELSFSAYMRKAIDVGIKNMES